MKIVTFIPARGGSKGLPRKNLKPLGGIPLIAWPIKHALECKYINDVVVTTDDIDIARVAKKFGANVPFIRPKHLAEDLTTTEDTLKHALSEYENKFGEVDLCVFLTCTDIFRKSSWLDEAIKIMVNDESIDSVFSGYKTHKNFWQKESSGKWVRLKKWMAKYSSRQIRQSIIREDTGLCCVSKSKLWREGRRIGDNVEVIENNDVLTAIDIHTKEDLKIAETLLPLRIKGII